LVVAATSFGQVIRLGWSADEVFKAKPREVRHALRCCDLVLILGIADPKLEDHEESLLSGQ